MERFRRTYKYELFSLYDDVTQKTLEHRLQNSLNNIAGGQKTGRTSFFATAPLLQSTFFPEIKPFYPTPWSICSSRQASTTGKEKGKQYTNTYSIAINMRP